MDMNHDKAQDTLLHLPATRELIEELWFHRKITKEQGEYALNLLYPADYQWGFYISKLLLVIGNSLMISGIIFFFAFNWAKIPPMVKLYAIQFSIVYCVIAAYYYSLENLSSKILLLSGSILIGVYLAVLGQIYQTGANSYELFAGWVLLTFCWTLISNFSVQWFFWLLITNISLILWWQQAASPSKEMEFMIMTYMIMLNGTALAVREYLVKNMAYTWLDERWMRSIVVILLLILMSISIMKWIDQPLTTSINSSLDSTSISVFISIIGLGIIYYFYRFKLRDILPITGVMITSNIIFFYFMCCGTLPEAFSLNNSPPDQAQRLILLVIKVLAIFILPLATIRLSISHLRRIVNKWENERV
jgi:uncharacterized membrane protein